MKEVIRTPYYKVKLVEEWTLYIRPALLEAGYCLSNITPDIESIRPYIVLNRDGELGVVTNLRREDLNIKHNRYEETNLTKFLSAIRSLMGKPVIPELKVGYVVELLEEQTGKNYLAAVTINEQGHLALSSRDT